MKYYVITGTFNKGISAEKAVIEEKIREHLQYLEKGFQEGWLLFSGPKVGSGGGVIVMKAESEEIVQSFLTNDPLKLADIQEYTILEFKMHKCQTALDGWFCAE